MNSTKLRQTFAALLMMISLTFCGGTTTATETPALSPELIRDCLTCRQQARLIASELEHRTGQLAESRAQRLELAEQLQAAQRAQKNAEDRASAWYRSPWLWVTVGAFIGGSFAAGD